MKAKLLLLTSICTLLFSISAFSLETQPQKESVDTEIIEIIGKFSKAQLKQLVRYAELDFYEMYNQYNDDFDLAMICEPKSEIGSNIKRQHCEPVYFKTEYNFQNQAVFLQDNKWRLGLAPSDQSVLMAVKKKRKQADANMLALAEKHPDLKIRMERYVKAKRLYEISRTIRD